jgi:endo-alpha-1,4-polygalactosaminidase (GH114 family)
MARALLYYIILTLATLSWANTLPQSFATEENPTDFEDYDNVKNLAVSDAADDEPQGRNRWQPVDAPYQIVLSKIVTPSNTSRSHIEPSYASVFEVDLFDTPASTFRSLKRQGIKVICYFSAGTSEDWRPDYKDFQAADKGSCYDGWAGERWLDVRRPGVWNVMRKRIRLARQKGCDAIDPDNVDVANNTNGIGTPTIGNLTNGIANLSNSTGKVANVTALTNNDTIIYVRKLAREAHRLRMAFGLKNTPELLPHVSNVTDFAVNESCAQDDLTGGCGVYANLTAAGKPVYHIEYTNYTTDPRTLDLTLCSSTPGLANLTSQGIRDKLCMKGLENTMGKGFSTVIKNLGLDEFVLYCDGRWAKTPVIPSPIKKALIDCPVVDVPGAELQLPSPQGEGWCNAGNLTSKGLFKGSRRRV